MQRLGRPRLVLGGRDAALSPKCEDQACNQQDLNAFRGWLDELPGLTAAGFYEAAVDIPNRTMTLMWHGPSPLRRQAIQEATRRGLHVVIKSVPYTKGQVEHTMHQLLSGDLTASGGRFHVVSVGGPTLGDDQLSVSGFFVGARPMASPATVGSDLAAAARARGGMTAEVSLGGPSYNYCSAPARPVVRHAPRTSPTSTRVP